MVNYSGLSRFELIKIRDYYMTIRHLVLSLLTVSVLSCAHGENVEIDFHYEGNNRADFSKLKGSLQIAEFFDERQVEDPKLITSKPFGNNEGGYYAEVALTQIIQTAFQQGFEASAAVLVDADPDFIITGSILAIDATTVDRAGVENIQITFRTKLELRAQGRIAWQTTLFGRGRAPTEEGVVPAVKEALLRTVGELIADDYFKMEII
jgi:hypothetical protein